MISCKEYDNLLKHATTVARLLNDLQTYKKERIESKPNCIHQLLVKGNGVITEEEATAKTNRGQLLQMVLQTEGSSIPRVCKDVFWTRARLLIFYTLLGMSSAPRRK